MEAEEDGSGRELSEYAVGTCYGGEAPQMLIAMWCRIISSGGLFIEGIFRVAPDAADCTVVEKCMLKGKLESGPAFHPIVLAHLIKKFLRELPDGGLPAPLQQSFSSSARARSRAKLDQQGGCSCFWMRSIRTARALCCGWRRLWRRRRRASRRIR